MIQAWHSSAKPLTPVAQFVKENQISNLQTEFYQQNIDGSYLKPQGEDKQIQLR